MKYYVVKSKIESEELNEDNYGIMLLHKDGNREYMPDISVHIEDVEFLVDRMNKYNIELCQAKEIIEDFKFNKK